jgi:hypothetical protein
MTDDVRQYIYSAFAVFILGILTWIGIVYVNACGFTLKCTQGQLSVQRTPIPTLVPATLPVIESKETGQGLQADRCRVPAVQLIGSWVEAGAPEVESFSFIDLDERMCEAGFNDIQPLFVDANVWYPGSISCVSCHSLDVSISPAQLDLSSYEGILSGSRRADSGAKGKDILGDGNWEASLLLEFLSVGMTDIPGHSEGVSGLVISAGNPLPEPVFPGTPEAVVTSTSTPKP